MSGSLVFLANPKSLNVVSTDTRISYEMYSVSFVVLRTQQIVINLFLKKRLEFDILNFVLVYKGKLNITI